MWAGSASNKLPAVARPFTLLAAVPTPLSPDGRAVDLDALGALVDALAGAGVGVVTATAGAGEGHLLSSSERGGRRRRRP